MGKHSRAEAVHIESIVATLSIKRFTDKEILEEIQRQTNGSFTKDGLTAVKQRIRRQAWNWYKTLEQDQYEYLYEFKQRINEITDLQRFHNDILSSKQHSISIKQNSAIELHKLNITLANYFDVAPEIINNANINKHNAIQETPKKDSDKGQQLIEVSPIADGWE